MNRAAALSVDNILRFLQVSGDGASLNEISRGLHLRSYERRALLKMLAKLKKRKAIVEPAPGRFALKSRRTAESRGGQEPAAPSQQGGVRRDRNGISGRLILHQDGYGL